MNNINLPIRIRVGVCVACLLFTGVASAQYRFDHWTADDGLPQNSIHAIHQARDGYLWLATSDGLVRFDGVRFTVFNKSNSPGIASNRFNCLYEDRHGDLWIGTENGGVDQNRNLHIISLDPWAKRAVLHPPPSLLEWLDIHKLYLAITALYEDREGNLWIGTERGGLYRARKQVITAYSKQRGLVDNNVYPIYEDRAGAVWIGAWYTGLSRFKDGAFTNYTKRDGLSSGLVTAVGEDQAGRLWVAAYDDASSGGLRVFENGRFTVPGGLAKFDGQVSAIYQERGQDRAGALWFGSDRGLMQYQDGALTTWTTKDGLAGDEVKVIIEGAAGGLWIGCYGGLSRFKDGKLTSWTERDGLASNAVRALYEDRDGSLWIGSYDGGLSRFKDGRFTRYTTKEELFNDGVFQVLEDARGNFWMSCNRGVYRVIAANSDGVWNTEGQSLRVIVLPPFYRTWWFITLAAADVAGLLGFAWRYRVAQFKQAQAAQQAFARRLIESQESERKRIAAELHDSLGQSLLVIKNRALLQAMTLSDGPSRSQFNTFSDAVSQTLEEVRTISHDPRPPHLDQLGLRTALVAMIERVAASSTIRFTHDLGELDGVLPPGDEITLYRIAQESLNNILKHSGATNATINIAVQDGLLTLTIRDNGRGFMVNGDPRRAGMGLQGIAERARILGGAHEIHSAPGQGVTVTVRIELKGK